ncbi:Hypothetical predicted protein, partial [Mytilus galloprovincialis]
MKKIALNKKNLVGSSNESEVTICGIKTQALLDTGSCVSTINEEFYNKHLSHLQLSPVEGILNVECADGNVLPYKGLIEADLTVKGIPLDHVQHCLFLVVPESRYSKTVPILLGTNILAEFMNTCKEKVGEKYLQDSALFTPWYLVFRCMTIREKTLKKKKDNRLAIVRCAEQQRILIRPNTSVSIKGYLNQETEYQPTGAVLEATQKSVLTDDLDIAPTVITYNFKDTGIIKVNVSNITTRTVSVPPNAILCELQPVVVENVLEMTDTPGQPMAQVDMRELRKQQRDDSLIGFWVRAVKDKRIPNKELEERLKKSFEIVQKAANEARNKQKTYFDKSARASNLEIGDKVLVKILAFEGKHKLADKFEDDIYEIVDKPNRDIPVFIVRSQKGKERTLHRNHLLPVGSKDIENTISIQNEEEKLDTQSKNVKHTSEVKCDVTCEFETESDTDCELDISINYPPKINAHSIDGETQNANEVNTEQEIVLESPVPRRSARRRKKPEWHSFYQMNQISVRESLPETKHVL